MRMPLLQILRVLGLVSGKICKHLREELLADCEMEIRLTIHFIDNVSSLIILTCSHRFSSGINCRAENSKLQNEILSCYHCPRGPLFR